MKLKGQQKCLSLCHLYEKKFLDPVSCTTSDDDDNEFFDAQELSGQDGTFSLNMPANIGDANGESSSESEELNSCETEPQSNHPSQVTNSFSLYTHLCQVYMAQVFSFLRWVMCLFV